MMAEFDPLSVSEAAEELSRLAGERVRPQQISLLLYGKDLNERSCPRVGHAHIIDREYLPEILRILRRRGWVGKTGRCVT